MIELRINNKLLDTNVYIENYNYITVENHKTLYYFINSFYNIKTNIHIGNYKVDLKSCYIINLLDYESISNQLQLKKGTILYDYILSEILEKVEDSLIDEEIEIFIEKLLKDILIDKKIDYDFNLNIDLLKIISNYININIDLSIENYVKIIKQLITNMRKKNIKKQIIIFVNEHIFNNSLDNIENVFIFYFYSKQFPNLLFSEKVINIDNELMINNIRLNWPCDITTNDIEEIINLYIDYSTYDKIVINDYKQYLGFLIINKILEINKDIRLIYNDIIPKIYENCIKSLIYVL